MELKVFLDGAQRIVSGVTSETTCRDIVLCLAQASQQYGKFVLVEKWQNNERLLSPNDAPLKILAQWAERAPDVNFIIKRCDYEVAGEPTAKSSPSSSPNGSKLNQSQLNYYKELEKPRLAIDKNRSVTCGIASDPYRFNEAGESGKLRNSSSHPQDLSLTLLKNNPSVRRPKCPPPYYEAIAKSTLLTRSSKESNHPSPDNSRLGEARWPSENHPTSIQYSVNEMLTPNNARYEPRKDSHLIRTSKSCDDIKTRINFSNDVKIRESIECPKNSQPKLHPDECSSVRSHFQERDPEDIRYTHPKTLDGNGPRMDLASRNLEKNRIEEEKKILGSQLAEIENQIENCRRTIDQLIEQINHLNIQKHEEFSRKREEERIKERIIETAKEKYLEFERQSEEIKQIDAELKESDEVIKERIEKVEHILRELKEANLQGLSLLPREDLISKRNVASKSSGSLLNPEKNTVATLANRPGSTRRIFGSPRELKNAVATSKSPHGVWV